MRQFAAYTAMMRAIKKKFLVRKRGNKLIVWESFEFPLTFGRFRGIL